MFEKILVPLDGSARAEAIMRRVEDLASCQQSEVILLRVIEPSTVMVGQYDSLVGVEEIKRLEEDAKQYLSGRRGELREKGISARIQVVYGPVVESIIRVADTENVDLIAMASHGRSGLARVFYGSVAAGVLNRVERPLLLVRAMGKS